MHFQWNGPQLFGGHRFVNFPKLLPNLIKLINYPIFNIFKVKIHVKAIAKDFEIKDLSIFLLFTKYLRLQYNKALAAFKKD